jgi:hypothetical protein
MTLPHFGDLIESIAKRGEEKEWKCPPGSRRRKRYARRRLTAFSDWLARERGLRFADYDALWRWSVEDLEGFWGCHLGLFRDSRRDAARPRPGERAMPGAQWFPGVTHELRRPGVPPRDGGRARPSSRATKPASNREMSWAELRRQVGALAASLRAMGVTRGDRVVAYLPNIPETIGRLPRRSQHRRHLVGLLAGHGAHRGGRPLPPDCAEGADRRRWLPLWRQGPRPRELIHELLANCPASTT